MGHSQQYIQYIRSKKWRDFCNYVHATTGHHCVLFPWLKSNHVHHLHYANLEKEVIVFDVVPLSRFAHSIIHFPILWKNKKIRFYVNILLRVLYIFWFLFYFIIENSVVFFLFFLLLLLVVL